MRFKIDVIDLGNVLQNYIWMLVDTIKQQAVAIDPTEGQAVLDYCTQHNLELSQIWITHKHGDHIGGIPLLKKQTQAVVYVPEAEKQFIAIYDYSLIDGQKFTFNNLTVDIITTPGHTLGHICYFIDELDALFCGDTLFAMGCGRLFEGTATQMYHSLNRLAALPPRTLVYCTHEYTQSNATFALTVEPENVQLQHRNQQVIAKRQANQITLPSTIALELQTNPFLRCQNVEQFRNIRELKDQF